MLKVEMKRDTKIEVFKQSAFSNITLKFKNTEGVPTEVYLDLEALEKIFFPVVKENTFWGNLGRILLGARV